LSFCCPDATARRAAGQAFLLRVLTDPDVGWWVAGAVALAGIVASIAAAFSLWHTRDREVTYSESVAADAIALGLGDPRRKELEPKFRDPRRRLTRWLLNRRAYIVWLTTLAAFVVADLFALIGTRRSLF
jgi:hypothetical protein